MTHKRNLAIVSTILALVLAASVAVAQPEPQAEVTVREGVTLRLPAGWTKKTQFRNGVRVVRATTEKRPYPDAWLTVITEQRRDHADALNRVSEIAGQHKAETSFVVIEGWPAIQQQYRAALHEPGEEDHSERKDQLVPHGVATHVVVAVAAGASVINLSGIVVPEADQALAGELSKIAHSLRIAEAGNPEQAAREIEQLRKTVPSPAEPPPGPGSAAGPSYKNRGGGEPKAGFAAAQNGWGELEVAASNDGQNVVIAANSGYSWSSTGGTSFTAAGALPCPYLACNGDPSLAVGRSGTMYFANIGYPNNEGTPPLTGVTDTLFTSPTGQTWTFRSAPVYCPSGGTGSCTLPDQEHIAADRVNAGTGGNDQVYVVWRNFPDITPTLVCSSDGGTNWGTAVAVDTAANGDFPRVSVGIDGSVYVAYVGGSNILLNKFSSCTGGLTQQTGFPHSVGPYTLVGCPLTGLDRCAWRNTMESPIVAPDDLEPNHVYVAYATATSATNEDIMVYSSSDGGTTFPNSVPVNAAVTAHRVMPWAVAYGGVAYVSWYDRRNAVSGATNDLARFYRGSAAVKGGTLVSSENDVSTVDDPQCASGWPTATDGDGNPTVWRNASEGCTTQPQLAGRCRHTPNNSSDSKTPCDFSSTTCPATETCQTGRGWPKYGDYNGVAAAGGRLFTAWASGTAPPGITAPGGTTVSIYSDVTRLDSDYYIRDWTSLTGHDSGVEPSTNPVFYETSDIWNQTTATAYAPVNDWVIGDPAARGATNYAFARLSRRAPAAVNAPDANVSVQFFYADYGASNPLTSIGSESLIFHAADLNKTTTGHSYTIPATASTHVCIAAELTAPNDDFIPPSLAGGLVGPSDARILQDNNKAQRNLLPDSGTGAEGLEYYADIFNSDVKTRDIVLEYAVAPQAVSKISGGTLTIVGGESQPLHPKGRIVLPRVAPGENRWLKIRLGSFSGTAGELLPVHFTQIGDAGPFAGFSIAAILASPEQALKRAMREYASVVSRHAAISGHPRVKAEAKRVATAMSAGTVRLATLRSSRPALETIAASRVARVDGGDPLGVAAGGHAVLKAVNAGNVAATALALQQYAQRLDAQLTMAQKERGDRAALVHNLEWQRALFSNAKQTSATRRIVHESEALQRKHSAGVAAEVASLIRRILPELGTAARDAGVSRGNVDARLRAIKSATGDDRLQQAHRALLLDVDKQLKSAQ